MDWLRSLVPVEGQQHELIQMAAENAAETLQALQAQWKLDSHRQETALNDLQAGFKPLENTRSDRML